jgi:23S rRNA A1618 N6-methylase RlmF
VNWPRNTQSLPKCKNIPFISSVHYKNDNVNNAMIDFTNPEATRVLTKTILLDKFDLKWEMPLDHLIPPVSNRETYLNWIGELLNIKKFNTDILGIDMYFMKIHFSGTGASLIYPLIGHKKFGWKFIGTDIDPESLEFARKNIEINSLGSKISLFHNKKRDQLLVEVIKQCDLVDFCMCNPPFFADEEEAMRTNPNTVCVGSTNEMITSGGEIEFITTMINESLELKEKICWYTSMCGKKQTLIELKKILMSYGIKRVYTTEFLHGKTTRWGIAWTFQEIYSKVQLEIPKKSPIQIQLNGLGLTDIYKIMMVILQSHARSIKKQEFIGTIAFECGEMKGSVQIKQITSTSFILEMKYPKEASDTQLEAIHCICRDLIHEFSKNPKVSCQLL